MYRAFDTSWRHEFRKRVNSATCKTTWRKEYCLNVIRNRPRSIAALVINTPGTLAQISDVFSFGNINIQSLVVSPTEVPELSRLSVLCNTTDKKVTWIQEKLERLVCLALLNISSMDMEKSSKNERQHQLLILAKIKVVQDCHEVFLKAIQEFGGTIVHDDIVENNDHCIILEAVDVPERIEEIILKLLRNHSTILELHRSGPISLCTRHSTVEINHPHVFTPTVNPEVHKISSGNLHVKTTAELHSCNGNKYTAERLELHARIANQLFTAPQKNLSHPTFVLLIGIPGAGKSTILSYLDSIKTIELGSFVNLDIDNCITLFPEFYHLVLDIGLGKHSTDFACPHTRYKMCVDEAKFILKKNTRSAISNRQNIILHGSGKSLDNYKTILKDVISAGYKTHVVCVDVSTELAIKRVRKRSNGYGRDVPVSLIKYAASSIVANFPELIKISENSHLFDSSHRPPQLVWSKNKSGVTFFKKEHWLLERFKLI